MVIALVTFWAQMSVTMGARTKKWGDLLQLTLLHMQALSGAPRIVPAEEKEAFSRVLHDDATRFLLLRSANG